MSARTTLSTSEVAIVWGIPAGSVSRRMRATGARPVGTVRVGRSTVTRWALRDVWQAAPAPAP